MCICEWWGEGDSIHTSLYKPFIVVGVPTYLYFLILPYNT